MKRQDVALLEQCLAAFRHVHAVFARRLLRMLAAPDHDVHAERLAITGQQSTDLAVTPNAERLPAQHLAEPEIRWQRRGFQTGLLPRALLEVRDILRNPALGGHDQRPRQFRRRDRRAAALKHGNPTFGTGVDFNVAADLARLADHAQSRQLIEELRTDARTFAY